MSQASLQAAFNNPGEIHATAGNYPLSATILITVPIKLVGEGRPTQFIAPQGAPAFALNLREPCIFSDFSINGNISSTTLNAAITVDSPNFDNGCSRFDNLFFYNHYMAISFIRASGWVIRDSFFFEAPFQLYINNLYNCDWGDNTIIGSTFFGYNTANNISNGYSVGIRWCSSGGLKVIGNKFNVMSNPIQFIPNNGVVTVDFIFMGNSIEYFSNVVSNSTGVLIYKQAGYNATLNSFQFIGNQFNNYKYNSLIIPSNWVHLTSVGNINFP